MELSLERPGNYLYIRWVDDTSICVVDRTLTRSFIMGHDDVIEDWPVTDAGQITPALMQPLLALEPEVILIGTGAGQKFVPPAAMATSMRRGVGVEAMDNAAAARTHSVLAAEQRRVVAAFILPTAGEPSDS